MIEGSVLYLCVYACMQENEKDSFFSTVRGWRLTTCLKIFHGRGLQKQENLSFDSSWVETNDLLNCLPRQRLAVHRVGRVGRVFLSSLLSGWHAV